MNKRGILIGTLALSIAMLAGCGIEKESATTSESDTYTLEGEFTSSQEIVDDIYFSGFVDENTIVLSEDQMKETQEAYFTVEKGSRFTFYSDWTDESMEFEVVELNPKENAIYLRATIEK